MNKFNKKIIDLYIKTNKTKEFVSKEPTYQEILYFAKHSNENNLTCLTDYVLDSNNLDLIVDYAMYAKSISKKDIGRIVNNIYYSNSAEHISRLARNVNDLTEGHINLLTTAIIKTKNYTEMLKFYIGVKNLSETNKGSIYGATLKSKNNKAIIDFIGRVSELTQDKIGKLIDAIDSSDEFEYNKIMRMSENSKNNKYKVLLKVLDSNNINFIFAFISDCRDYVKNNEEIIFDKLVEIGNIKAIIDYYCDIVKNYNVLYENKVVCLLKESKNAELVIYFLSKYTLLNKESINTLEKIVLNSNDKLLIAKYILLTGNTNLSKEVFGELMYFYIFCKDILRMEIKLEEFKTSLEIITNEEYINFVDKNIENYNKNVASKK